MSAAVCPTSTSWHSPFLGGGVAAANGKGTRRGHGVLVGHAAIAGAVGDALCSNVNVDENVGGGCIYVVAISEAFYIENKLFDLDTLRLPYRFPHPDFEIR
jgi:hypothetical protein